MGLKPIAKMISEKSDTIMGYDKYSVKNAVETLQRAREIEGDPAFMNAVQAEAERQKDALSIIANKKGYFQPKRDRV